MRSCAKELKAFVSGFGLPAYTTDTVPDDVSLPYLTYPLVEPEWDRQEPFYIQGWYKTTSYSEMLTKADDIIRDIGTGIILSTDNGYVVIYPETPLVQIIPDEENGNRSFYISLSINSYHMPGD